MTNEEVIQHAEETRAKLAETEFGQRLAQRGISKVSEFTGIPKPLIQGAAATVIPAIATPLGAAVGALTSPVTGPVGPVAGAMAASGGAEKANQFLGITEPSNAAVGISAAMPGVGRAVGAGYQALKPGLARVLPGAGVELQKMGHEVAKSIGAAYRVTQQAVDDAYNVVKTNFNPTIELKSFTDAIKEKMVERSKALAMRKEDIMADPIMKELSSTLAQVKDFGGGAKLDMIRATLKDYSNRIGDIMQKSNSDVWAYLKGGLKTDLEAAKLQGPKDAAAVRALQVANATNSRRMGSVALDEAIEEAGKFRTKDLSLDFNRGGLYTKIQKAIEHKDLSPRDLAHLDDNLAKGFSKVELQDMADTLKKVGYIPGLVMEHATPMAVTGYLGYKATGTREGAVGGVLLGAGIPKAVSLLLQTEGGRRWLRNAVTGKGGVSPEKIMAAASALSSGIHGAASSGQEPSTAE